MKCSIPACILSRASGLALLSAALSLAKATFAPSEALAANECGVASGLPPTATCTSAGNPYATGITYSAGGSGLNLNLQSVGVNSAAGGVVVSAAGPFPVGPININGTGANTINTTGVANNYGIGILSGPATSIGNLSVNANAAINLNGAADIRGIFVNNQVANSPADLTINYSGPSVFVQAQGEAAGIHARSLGGSGNISITASGNITGTVTAFPPLVGIFAEPNNSGAGTGNGSIHYVSGTLNISGPSVNGIVALNRGAGSSSVTTDQGTIVNVTGDGTNSPGSAISVQSFQGLAGSGSQVVANIASEIQHTGYAGGSLRAGIRAFSGIDAAITVNYTGSGITTTGDNGLGILALSGSGTIAVNSAGPISSNGITAFGIRADSGGSSLAGNLVTVNATSPVTTLGQESQGIWASSPNGATLVSASNVITMGQFSSGIRATGASVAVNVAAGGLIMGGWQPGVSDVGSNLGLPSAGVSLSSTGAAVLTNNGSIGAWSDRAIAGDPQVINNGLITGFVQFTGGDNSILNTGTFNLRHFADTDGNAARDTLRVAFADLGDGPNNSFSNNGTLRLVAVTGATTLNSTGQYLPLGNLNNAMSLGGPLQGHLIGVTTFTNSGTIDLQSNPVAGDVLVITGERQAGVAGPGTFPGTFISNGGTLRLDTVLNQGGSATRSDTLVVDGTSVGAGGATSMVIRNAGGTGALTVGDGILVVQALNPGRSVPGAFSLNGGFITAGAFDYFLFKGGVSPGSQGNWYLRSALLPVPPEPSGPPLPEPVPGAPPIPLFNPEVALKSVVPSVARTLGVITLGTFNERQGDQLLVRGDTKVNAWGRVFGQQTREHFAQGARPDFDGTFVGFQAGADLWRLEGTNGHSDHIGFYVAQARATGSAHGLVDAFEGSLAGRLNLDASSYAGYWTHLGPSNWYIDAVLQGTHYYTSANSVRGIGNNFTGSGFAASIEAGYPVVLAQWLTFEPQIQGIWQRVSFDDTANPFSTITFDRADVFTGRAGALLRGAFGSVGAQWQPYLKGNVWWGSNGFDTVRFNDFPISTGRNGGTALEGGGGVTGKLTKNTSVYGDASYLTSVSGESRITLRGNLGLRVTW
jgi:outer membrane autotransporter protein